MSCRVPGPLVYGVLLLAFVPLPIWSQTGRLQKELNSAYKGKILLLRNFYSGNDLTYDQDGQLRSTSTEGPWTLADVEVTHVKITAHGIEIAGNRMGVLYKDGKPSFVDVGRLKIHVTKPISDSDTEVVIRPIFNHIFLGPGEDPRPLLPDYWQSYLDGNDLNSRVAAWRANLDKHGGIPAIPAKPSSGTVRAPHVIYSPDPQYSREAESKHIEGTSRLILVVSPSGGPDSIAIMDPLGMGLDDQAVTAIRQWRFQPAMKNGQFVRVQINIEMVFRCCP